jgi:hypothetical protein
VFNSPANAKKIQERYGISDDVILEFATAMGDDGVYAAFVKYKPSISPADLIKKGMKPGPELGEELNRLEKEVFLNIYNNIR